MEDNLKPRPVVLYVNDDDWSFLESWALGTDIAPDSILSGIVNAKLWQERQEATA